MNPFDANGWKILFYTDFQLQWSDLTAKVIKLKSKLEPKDFVTHPDVKLLKAIDSGIRDKISIDPFASHFSLRKPLQQYGRLKKMGLPQRYRIFFRAFAERKVIMGILIHQQSVKSSSRSSQPWGSIVNADIEAQKATTNRYSQLF